jgi:hypothetical protein
MKSLEKYFARQKKSRKIDAHKHRFSLMREKASSQRRMRKAWKKPKNNLATIMLLCDENRILENPGVIWNATKSQRSLFQINKSYLMNKSLTERSQEFYVYKQEVIIHAQANMSLGTLFHFHLALENTRDPVRINSEVK